MRILLLSQWCYPEPVIRIEPLAQTLTSRGHQVTIVTGFPNYPLGHIYPGYRQRLWQWEQSHDFKILRLPLYPDHSQSAIKRTLHYLSFAFSASTIGVIMCGGADVMWVYHPPLTIGLPAWWIGLLRGIPFVYEIQDMWPETVAASGMVTNRTAMKWLEGLAHFVYRRARAITVISPGFKQHLVAKGIPEEKIFIIPNWSNEDIYRPLERDPQLGERFGFAGRFNVVFAGNMGPAQDLATTLRAAHILKEFPDIQFVFIGDGLNLPQLVSMAQELVLPNVRFVERQPVTETPRFLAWGDALLVQLRNDPLFHMTIPSKTLAYLACGRPIICAVPGDGAEVVRQSQAGVICQPEDPAALAEAVLQLYAMPPQQRDKLGQNGRKAFLEHFSQQKLVGQYEQLFLSLVKN